MTVLIAPSPALECTNAYDALAANGSSGVSDPSSSASGDVAVRTSTYTPVQSSVVIVTDRIKTNARLQSALSTLQSYLPTMISEKAIESARLAQNLTLHYGQPIVERVDGKLSNAIVTILSAPQSSIDFGVKKIAQVDQIAYSFTPSALQPTYTKARSYTIEKANDATKRVVELKRAGEKHGYLSASWQQVTVGLEQIRSQLAAVRAAIVQAPGQAVSSLHLLDRLNVLQAKLNAALEVVRSKGADARALSNDLIASVREAAVQFQQYIESYLTKEQAALVHSLYAKLLEGAATLKDTLHLGSGSSSPSSSRRNSASSTASDVSNASFADIDEVSPPAPASVSGFVVRAVEAIESLTAAAPITTSADNGTMVAASAAPEVEAEQADAPGLSPLSEAEAQPTAASSSTLQQRKKKRSKAREAAEEKEKIDAE